MIRSILRTISVFCFAVAIVAAVLDITRSIADSQWIMTPLIEDWRRLAPGFLAGTESWITESVHPWLWDPMLSTVLRAPSWMVFTVIALLFVLLAKRRRQRWQENFGA